MPSIGRIFVCTIFEVLLGFFGLAQLAGLMVEIKDGDVDVSSWVAALVGAAAIMAAIWLWHWSIRPVDRPHA